MESGNSWSRERIREAVGNLIKCVAVDKANRLVVNGLLTQPLITSTEVLHVRRCDEGINHLLVSFVVFEQRGWIALRKTKISQNDAHAKCSATTVKRSQILSVSSTCGNGCLTAADMSNAVVWV